MSELMKIAELKPGMVIVRITEQNGPVKIRKSGLVTSDAMVTGLAEMGVLEVEVDPAQTVEIEKPVHHRTQTQKLIRGDHDTSVNKLDNAISEQFNRSLFLPTVQGLPSMWKVYSRQVMSFAGVIIVGLAIGGAAGSYPAWWPQAENVVATAPDDVADETKPGAVNEPEKENSPAEVDVVTDTNNSGDLAALDTEAEVAQSAKVAIAVPSELQPGAVSPEQAPAQTPVQQSETQAETAQRYAENSVQAQVDLGGEVINASQESDVEVSPELMARFNRAIDELDNRATEPRAETKVTVRDNMPRVHQLPVRMLTRLPSMAFNAHMYASRPSDRWVRVNGTQLGEGDWIEDEVQIVKIEAQRVILSFEGKEFSMAALTDW